MFKNINISSLYGPENKERKITDKAIFKAANEIGFLKISGLQNFQFNERSKKILLSIFKLPKESKKKLCRWYFENSNQNVYRGWFPLQNGLPTYKQGIDIGPDLVREVIHNPNDPLTERTPLPRESELPKWRSVAKDYYLSMESLGLVIMQSIARSLKIDQNYFDKYFNNSNSTLRLLHYPVRDKISFGKNSDSFQIGDSYSLGKPHVDSGLLTILQLDHVAGLQAQLKNGEWHEIEPEEGTLVMNFGRLLEQWSNYKIKATVHRVIGYGQERYSIPFFFEPSIDSYIKPIDELGEVDSFKPFFYGDWLWEVTTQFIEQSGIKHLRKKVLVKSD